MRKEIINLKNGQQIYSFVYYNSVDQKRIRLSRDYIRARFGKDINDEQEAEKILHILGKELNCLANEKENRLSLTPEEYEFNNLIDIYIEEQKKSAPNSWENNLHFFKYYVLHYFLRIKECSKLEEWPIYYEDFKAWLESSAFLLRDPGKLISYASKNHAIRALNTFMHHMQRKRYLLNLQICGQFPSHLQKEKSIDDVITASEMKNICAGLKEKGKDDLALFYRLLYFTGMRYNEGRGISLENIFPGKIEDKTLAGRLSEHGIKYYGYIVINSQPKHKRKLREEDGSIRRKPLKSRKKIDEKSARIIPIIDRKLWEGLGARYNCLIPDYEKRLFGENLGNYVLFEHLNASSSTILRKVFYYQKVPYRSWHALRHTRATLLVGETGDFMLVRLWLGHKKQEVLEKYVHTYQAMVRNAKKKNKNSTGIKLLEL